MLWFVGLGISGTQSIPIEVVKIIQEADFVYLEAFTSPISKQHEDEIKNMLMEVSKLQKDGWLRMDKRYSRRQKVLLLSYYHMEIHTWQQHT